MKDKSMCARLNYVQWTHRKKQIIATNTRAIMFAGGVGLKITTPDYKMSVGEVLNIRETDDICSPVPGSYDFVQDTVKSLIFVSPLISRI